jgi:DnaJ-class molecular chaperone
MQSFLFSITPNHCFTKANPSKLLGIDKQASEKEIKRAYRTLSKKYHPDKNPYDPSSRTILFSY